MLQLDIAPVECFDDKKQEFYYAFPWDPTTKVKPEQRYTVQLEHSLLSLSRWEEKWEIPFLVEEPKKTTEQVLDYIRFMTLTKNVPPGFYTSLSPSDVTRITDYIQAKHTATWFSEEDDPNAKRGKPQIVTAEVIYYWMISQQIPWDPCEKWHLNKLMTLIKVCTVKNKLPEKKNQKQLSSEFARVKAARRAARAKKH